MTPQIQSLIARRSHAMTIIQSILSINAEDTALKGVFQAHWDTLDLIDKKLRELNFEPKNIKIQNEHSSRTNESKISGAK